MNGFIGTETHSIDQKGRLAIPAAIRRQAAQAQRSVDESAAQGEAPAPTFVIVMGFEGCLALYNQEGWRRIRERLEQLPIGGRKARMFSRTLHMDAKEVTADGQGRITLPPALVARAGLDKEVVLLGQGHKVEIWNPERLRAAFAEMDDYEKLAEDTLG